MWQKPVIFLDFKKDYRLDRTLKNNNSNNNNNNNNNNNIQCKHNILRIFLNFLKINFHIVYILGKYFQKIIKCYKLSEYLEKHSNNVEDYSHPTSVIFIKEITSLIGHYSIKLDINNHDKMMMAATKCLNIHVDYLSYGYFWKNYNRIIRDIYKAQSNYNINIIETLPKTVIVFDLDETIIDQDYRLVCSYVEELLVESRNIFDYMVLWSHGNTNHVQKAMTLYKLGKLFDLVLTRGRFQYHCFNKGFGLVLKHLNKTHGIAKVKYSVLVDDQIANFNNDYTYFFKVDKKINNTQYKKKIEKLKNYIENTYGNIDKDTLNLLGTS